MINRKGGAWMSLFQEMIGKLTDCIVERDDIGMETEEDKAREWVKNFYKEHYEEVVGLRYLVFRMSLKEIKNEELRQYVEISVKKEMKRRLEDKIKKVMKAYDSYVDHIGIIKQAYNDSEERINEIGRYFSQRTVGSSENAFVIHIGRNAIVLSSFIYFRRMAKLFDEYAYKTELGWELSNDDQNKSAEKSDKEEKKPHHLTVTGFWMGIASIFLFFIFWVPFIGMILSIVGLFKYDKEKNRSAWYGWIGLVLNILYILENLYQNGHLR